MLKYGGHCVNLNGNLYKWFRLSAVFGGHRTEPASGSASVQVRTLVQDRTTATLIKKKNVMRSY